MSRLYVCRNCIEDPDLQDVVWKNQVSEECDYCGQVSKTPIACELSDVIERMWFVVRQYYSSPANLSGQPSLDQYDVLGNLGFEVRNDLLMQDILRRFACEEIVDENYWAGDDHERFLHGWERFKYIVTHHRRYTFANIRDSDSDYDEFPPSTILSTIAETIRDIGPVTVADVGISIWRVRKVDGTSKFDREEDFTPPPVEFAKSPNRMSPAGIPMFYGADDFETAVKETVEPDEQAVGVCFKTLVQLNLLDLAAIPEIRMFSDMKRNERQAIMFLKKFRDDVSKPVEKDHAVQHIEYVPTQIFTEYIRFEAKTPSGEPYHGIRYPSSITGEPCYVLFLDDYDCKQSQLPRYKPQILQAILDTRKTS